MSTSKRGRYIGPAGLAQLHKYKYRGEDHSLLSKFVLQPFWNSFVLLIPTSVAPNAVTLAGFLCIVASSLLCWVMTPTVQEPFPGWVALFHALCLFLYQTLDAVDGKQARRTGSSSPLGELFDHGCDALVATMEVLPFSACLRLGPRRSLLVWLFASSTFLMATWENFNTHVLRLPIMNGPTEGLFMFYSIFSSVALSGTEWWYTPVPVPQSARILLSWVVGPCPESGGESVPLVDILMFLFLSLGILPTLLSNVLTVRESLAQKQSSNTGTRSLRLYLTTPYWVLVVCVFSWGLLTLSPGGLLSTHPHWFFIPPTFSLGLMAGRLILAHVTGEEQGVGLSMWQPLLLQPLVLGNALLAAYKLPHLPESATLAALTLHTGVLYTHFVVGVIREICEELGISCFRLKAQRQKDKGADTKTE